MSVTPSPSKRDESGTDWLGRKKQSKKGFSSGYNRDDPPKGLDFDKLSPDERHRALDSCRRQTNTFHERGGVRA
jgi:hypothetical protein